MKNKFFEEMWNTLKAYEEAKENGESPERPYTAGQIEAVRSYVHGGSKDETEVLLNGFLWERDIPDFIATLRKAGIKSLVTTDHSTALMETLHSFEAEGCKLKGLCKVTEESRYDGTLELPGIRFSL